MNVEPVETPIPKIISTNENILQFISTNEKILRTQPLCPNTFHNHNPTIRIRYYSCLQHSHYQLLQKSLSILRYHLPLITMTFCCLATKLLVYC